MLLKSILSYIEYVLSVFYQSLLFPYVLILLMVWGAYILVASYADIIVGGLGK